MAYNSKNKNFYRDSLFLHEKLRGKIAIIPKLNILDKHDLSLVYTPGVAEPCREIYKDKDRVWDYTIKKNTVAVVSDGSAVLGLGNLGAHAAIPVMEGKAMLFKKFADINAFPICLDTQDVQSIIDTVRYVAPVFGGINLEDISSPRSFIIEDSLQDLGIPVFHDDQHGTAVVLLAGLINACKLIKKSLINLKVVINGAGAAGIAIARLLSCQRHNNKLCIPVKDILVLDSKGIVNKHRNDLNDVKKTLLSFTNNKDQDGDLSSAIKNADVFIGVSSAGILKPKHIKKMNTQPLVFALANPEPEIMPDIAYKAGAAIVATGRSDFANQINNVLGFPGIFRGALDAQATRITSAMKIAAAYAISDCIPNPKRDEIVPTTLDQRFSFEVSQKVYQAA